MIDLALALLRDELNEYIRSIPGNNDPVYVTLGNVSAIEGSNNNSLNDTILVSLVNIEEESTLKNLRTPPRMIGNRMVYDSAPAHLNLYILFACNFPDDYNNALIRLSQVIQRFQSKKVFNLQNTVSDTVLAIAADPNDPRHDLVRLLSLALDLYTMTFEQINHLWGSLGGKQIPFGMYKVRLVELAEPKVDREAPPIEQIRQDVHPLNEAC
ncbi:MAG: DUF4255 domain-containing protein [Saprospiraceae bacterium]|nr:DUF4255 domain-containing protein [Saprospiraceae bacterium]